ncbi:MAG: DUF5671 domain-containing protein [Chloroflexi bacterium]|nr:DUF5671 domain-containing protein [Chloroflexota bacterium]
MAVNLLSTIARAVLEPAPLLMDSPGFYREEVASSAAMLIVALPIWLVHWLAMQRSASAEDEAVAIPRRFYILLVLAVSAITALVHTAILTRTALELATGMLPAGGLPSLVRALGWIIVYGSLWYYHAPLAAPSAPGMVDSTLRRWYLYIVTAFSLAAAAWGLGDLLRDLLRTAITPGDTVVTADGNRYLLRQFFTNAPWAVWGGVWWFVFFRRLAADDRGSLLRRLYMYTAMFAGLSAALWGLSWLLYELLRFALGYRGAPAWSQWVSLGDALPRFVIGTPIWLYHRALAREEESAADVAARIYRYLLAAAGLPLLTIGLAMLVRLLMDFAFGTFAELRGDDWWRDSLSMALVLVIVGLPVWTWGWGKSQSAVALVPAEAYSLGRRAYLFAVLLVSVLAVLGFLGAALNTVLQLALGQPATAHLLSDLFTLTGYAAIAGGVLAYHATIARRELGIAAPDGTHTRHIVLVMAPPDARAAAEALARQIEGTVTLRTLRPAAAAATDAGTTGNRPADGGEAALEAVAEAVRTAPTERVLVLFRSGGADVYPYD